MNPSLLIMDFDGTLLNDAKKVSQKDLETLEAVRKRGVKTVIATGRSIASFEKALNDMGKSRAGYPWPVDYLIFSTGAGIIHFSTWQILYQRSIPVSGIMEIKDYFEQEKMDYMILKEIPDTHFCEYRSFGKENPDFQYRLELYKEYASPLNNNDTISYKATEVIAILPAGTGMEKVRKIKKDLHGFSVIQATSPLDHRSVWVEVFHPDVCKSVSARWLCQKLGLGHQDTAAVGNDYNDLDLLEWVNKGFVVSNAPDSMKSEFETVSSNNESGVSRAAERLNLAGQ